MTPPAPRLSEAAAEVGLSVLGLAPVDPSDDAAVDGVAAVALLGPRPGVFWPVFSQSPEASDGAPHPMDRWSRRVGDALAERLDARAYYPFGGPPYQPFFRWALTTGRLWPSPIGPLVGADHGLLASFRLALGFGPTEAAALRADPMVQPATRPCDICIAPCASTCPVDAFRDGAYDVDRCRAHIATPDGAECLERGCLARRACPAAAGALQPPAQATHHMRAFLAAGGPP